MLFVSTVDGDYRVEPDSLRLWLGQGGLGLPKPQYYEDADVERVYREVVRSAVSDMYARVEHPYDIVGRKHKPMPKRPSKKPKDGPFFEPAEVIKFERKLAKVSVNR